MFRKVLFFALIGLFCAANLFAQNTKGTITGTVLDPNGAVVPNAILDVTHRLSTRDALRLRFGSFSKSVLEKSFLLLDE